MMTAIVAKVDAFAKKVDGITLSQPSPYFLANSSNDIVGNEFVEQVDYLGNPVRSQNSPYSNTYNPGWRNQPTFSWSNPQIPRVNAPAPGFQRPPPPPFPEKQSNLEDMIAKFIQTSRQFQQATDAALRNHEASIHNLETQVGQITKLLSERPQGSLPGNTKPNPKEFVDYSTKN